MVSKNLRVKEISKEADSKCPKIGPKLHAFLKNEESRRVQSVIKIDSLGVFTELTLF